VKFTNLKTLGKNSIEKIEQMFYNDFTLS